MWRTFKSWLPPAWQAIPEVPEALWRRTLAHYPFLSCLDEPDRQRLKSLSAAFLAEKEFHGAHGLAVTDEMALAIAAQACRPLLGMRGTDGRHRPHPLQALAWYDDFVGIVVQPGAALARRRVTDTSGVVHSYTEALAGEAMDRGPVMLSWEDVAQAGTLAERGTNVVIHEFVHKIDMRGMRLGEHPDGAPPLFAGFMGCATVLDATERWRRTMQEAYASFREALSMAERFGGETPWLDDYAAKDPAEFFAVTCEAYFVNPQRFEQAFPALRALYDAFFNA